MANGDETIPPASGEVDAAMHVVVCSRRTRLTGETLTPEGEIVVARDLAELLMALDEHQRTTVLVDAADSPIELGFLARLARDFPTSVVLVVVGTPATDRGPFHDHGVYRAQFVSSDDGVLPEDGRAIDRAVLLTRVIAMLDGSPSPLAALRAR